MRSWTGPPIAFARPDVGPDEIGLVLQTLGSTTLSGGGMLEAFERAWATRLGCRHAIGVSSGTAALHLAVIAAGVEADDLVITTPFSFVASSNVILYERAVPLFVDIDPETLAMDPVQTGKAASAAHSGGAAVREWLPPLTPDAAGPRALKAILPVHVFGRPADMTTLVEIADRVGVPVIEDACEAAGARVEGRHVGTIGRAGAFGFYPNKQVTTGEGGMLVTNDDGWAAVCRSLRNQGRDEPSEWLRHDRLGYNYRLDELSAAVGIAQMRRLDDLLARRERVAAMYAERLADCDWLRLPADHPDRSWFVYVVRLQGGIDRNAVMTGLAALGIPSRAYFPPIHLQPYYRERFGFREGMFPVTERVWREAIALPFHPSLSQAEVDFICDAMRHVVAMAQSGVAPTSGRGNSPA